MFISNIAQWYILINLAITRVMHSIKEIHFKQSYVHVLDKLVLILQIIKIF